MTRAGTAQLRFSRYGGATRLAELYTTAPLHARALATSSPDMARVALLTTGGGLLGDEQLRIELHLDVDARAMIAGVGATRLLPAGRSCRQRISATLGPGSRLILLPEPLIPCAGAAYEQVTHVAVAESAAFIAGEVVSAGRIGFGERFAYRRLDLLTAAYLDGRPALHDRVTLEPASGHLRSALGSWTHLATLVVVGRAATEPAVDRLRGQLEGEQVYGGVSLPAPRVLVARVLGSQAHALQALIRRMAASLIGVG